MKNDIFHCQLCQKPFKQKTDNHIFCCEAHRRRAEFIRGKERDPEKYYENMRKYVRLYKGKKNHKKSSKETMNERQRNFFRVSPQQIPTEWREVHELNYQLKKLIREVRKDVEHRGNP